MTSPIQLIVGLGNPGDQYHNTRHNAGEDFVSLLAEAHQAILKPETKFFGKTAKILLNGQAVHLLIPTTYMNLSGKAVGAFCQFYKISPEAILVAHDELDLSPGTARFKLGGGHGGHNGLKDIIRSLANSKQFARLRIGIGHPGNAKLVSNYVLKKAPLAEQQCIRESIDNALMHIGTAIEAEWEKAMHALHSIK